MSIALESINLSSSSNTPGACPVCLATGPFPRRPSTEPFLLFECPSCGIVFLFPQPHESQLASYYDETYYGEDRKKFLSALQIAIDGLNSWKWRKLQRLLHPTGRMLDIGCGRGTLVKQARNAGYEAYGLERESPVGHSVPGILYKSLPECHFPDGHFQLVVLWHVLEHLSDPVSTLREINRVLAPGGWLSVAVPNYGGAQAKASGANWFHLDLPRHLWHFRPESLERLLLGCGFQIRRRSKFSLEYDWFGTLQSWMNSALDDRNTLYSFLKGSEKPRSGSLGRIAASAALTIPALLNVLWDGFCGRGGTLEFLLQKTASSTDCRPAQ